MIRSDAHMKPSNRSLHAAYAPPAKTYDESCTPSGDVRAHWKFLVQSLEELGPEELLRRSAEANRLMSEMGVTYHVFDNPLGAQSPWRLDPVPVVISSQEWTSIERGLVQRAELLNLILCDLYGEQRLIREGLLPPEVVYGSPDFLRPCVGMFPEAARLLQVYAADLARSPDGRFWVISDRTQAPSGSAYALENRIVMSRLFPSLYRDSQVHRLSFYFRTLHQTLTALAPRSVQSPLIVVLTPGPDSETYFEHAFLARYLGYPLVQGSDLTVLDGKVFFRTLGGQSQVHVILRRQDDTFCDPLELRADSLLGTPGLLEAVRLGNVALANPPGSGVVQNPALMAYLPQLCRHLLGKDLLIPSVATWWCGTESERAHTLQNLDRIALRTLASDAEEAVTLRSDNKVMMLKRLERDPHLFFGQERVMLASVPALQDGRLEPRHMSLRTFLVARPDGYMVMPGGLTQVSRETHSIDGTGQRGGTSKDTWILASEPVHPYSLLPSGMLGNARITRGGGEVPGRVAENLYWMARNAERAEFLIRMVRPIVAELLEDASRSPSEDPALTGRLGILTHQSFLYPGFVNSENHDSEQFYSPVRIQDELRQLLFAVHLPGSIAFALNEMLQGAHSARDRLSDETARVISRMRDAVGVQWELPTDGALESLDALSTLLAAFSGLTTESMSRTDGWRFLEVGRRIERSLQTMRLLRTAVCEPPGDPGPAAVPDRMEYVLLACNSSMTYRRRYTSVYEEGGTVDLLLLDDGNPRSLAFQVRKLVQHVALLPQNGGRETLLEGANRAQKILHDFSPSEEALSPSGPEIRAALSELLPQVAEIVEGLSNELTTAYFRTATMRQMPREFQ